MTEPLGRAAGAAALEGVDPAAWLSEKRETNLLKEKSTPHYSLAKTQTMSEVSEMTHGWV